MKKYDKRLDWFLKTNSERFYRLDCLNLKDNRKGVYVIWYSEPTPVTVYVGQGILSDRLYYHRVLGCGRAYGDKHILYVSWAIVPDDEERNGIEAFLHQQLNPLYGERTPADFPICVNYPWD